MVRTERTYRAYVSPPVTAAADRMRRLTTPVVRAYCQHTARTDGQVRAGLPAHLRVAEDCGRWLRRRDHPRPRSGGQRACYSSCQRLRQRGADRRRARRGYRCLCGFWWRRPEGLGKEPVKSQSSRNWYLDLRFLRTGSREDPVTATCGDAVGFEPERHEPRAESQKDAQKEPNKEPTESDPERRPATSRTQSCR